MPRRPSTPSPTASSGCEAPVTESATAQESVVRTAAERGSFWPCVLVANRGEIAVRVVRTLRKLGIRAAVCYTEADADSPAVQAADVAVAVRGYLDVAAVLEAAQRAGAAAIHPGYGFLSENAEFARACAAAGIVFIGPPPEAITVMGDKITAKQAVAAQGVPTIPGVARAGLNDAELAAAAVELGFPVLVKPAAGGGGKGMRRVVRSDELGQTLASARREAAAAFGDDTLFLERLVARPRHIEMQIVADGHGAVVHLGERECSLQRRHQKVIEEAPSPLVDPGLRERMGAAACAAARSVGYRGAGTVEFLVSEDDPERFYFMEMNTRLQVEHPVTEVVTGIDVVECQLRIAAGEPLGFGQGDVRWTGHAIEARVYAEDPGRGFLPTGGRVLELSEPNGPAVRVDSGLRAGMAVGVDYDPMLSKVIASGPDRAAALAALDRALADTVILGVTTNIEFLRFLLADVDVAAGRLDTELVDRLIGDFHAPEPGGDVFVAAALHRWLGLWNGACREAGDWATPSGWRIGGRDAPVRYRLSVGA
ncbi:MAG: ATP-grasp domain-containing protein, partial [Mycobacteriaceae bacterium]|nr:ATP-grasp domain-containing protein [Mycobacteriaceae bacterium]